MKQIQVVGNDLGNGYCKRTYDGENVLVDPSVLAEPTSLEFFSGGVDKTISVNGGRKIYIGQEAYDSGHTIQSALGDSDLERYEHTAFKELLFGFTGSDIQDDVQIDLMVLGLPIAHFSKKRETLQNVAKGKTIVNVGGEDMVISVKDAIALPQPLGTYSYLQSVGYDTSGRTLVVDGGFGTLDITEMKGMEVVSFYGRNIGMKKAYLQIQRILEMEFAGYEVALSEIPKILSQGLKVGGTVIFPKEMPKVQKVLKDHFDEVHSFIIQNYGSTIMFDNVVWTGGLAQAHKEEIQGKEQGNFMILEGSQKANALGYYRFGMGLIE